MFQSFLGQMSNISIHAPREGSDSNLRQNKDLYFGENATCFKK